MCRVGMALGAIAEVLRVRRYEVGNATADESAACVRGRGRPEPAHHLGNTSDGNPRATGTFPAAAGGTALPQLREESQDRQEPQSFARCRKTGTRERLQGFLTQNRDTPMQ